MLFDVFSILCIVAGVCGVVSFGFAVIYIVVATFRLPKIDFGFVVMSFGIVLILLVAVALCLFILGLGLHHFGLMLNYFNSPFSWISN